MTSDLQPERRAGEDFIVYRSMIAAPDGAPAVGATARMLGVRPGIDIAVDTQGRVLPGTGGLSVAPGDPLNLPRHRRPPEFDGTGADPVWSVRASDLGPDLAYRPDPLAPARHGFVEPARPMSLVDFKRALARTRNHWRRHVP